MTEAICDSEPYNKVSQPHSAVDIFNVASANKDLDLKKKKKGPDRVRDQGNSGRMTSWPSLSTFLDWKIIDSS